MLGLLGQVFVLGDDVLEHLLADIQAVVSLFEGDAEDIAALDGGGLIIGVDLNHIIASLALGFQDIQGLVGIARGDDAVGYLSGQEAGGIPVAHIGQGGPVSEGAQPVGPRARI